MVRPYAMLGLVSFCNIEAADSIAVRRLAPLALGQHFAVWQLPTGGCGDNDPPPPPGCSIHLDCEGW